MLAVSEVIQHALFEQPWPAAAVLAVLAAALSVAGKRQKNKLMRRGSVAVAMLAGAVVALAYSVETGNEAVERHTRQLVATTAPLDLPAFEALLAPDARLLGADDAVWLTGREIVGRLEGRVTNEELDQRITGLEVEPVGTDPDQRTVILDLRTKATSAGGLPILTSWALTWQRGPDAPAPQAWTLRDVRWLRFNQQPPPRSLVR